jgi:hypothetical protein
MLSHKKPRPGSLDDAEAAKRGRYRRSRVSGAALRPRVSASSCSRRAATPDPVPCVPQVQTVVGQLLRARPYSLLLLAAAL